MTKISGNRQPAAPGPKNAPATQAAAEPKPTVATDSLQMSKPVEKPKSEALKVLDEAAQLPEMPKDAAGQKAWLMDGFTRLMKMNAANEALRKDWSAGKISGNDLSVGRSRIWNVEEQLRKAPGHDEAKKEFFGGVINQANSLLDGLAKYPAAPADKAGKKAWLAQAKTELAKAKEAERIMKDCWFEYKALPFEGMSAASKKVWDFEGQIRKVDYELNPPPPRQPGSAPSTGGPGRPLFELTQAAQKGLDSKNPVGQTVGAVVLPIALTLDVIDAITRPFQWLESAQRPQPKKK